MDRTKDRDVVLGKTLAETALSNSPEYLAGAEASAAVQRVARRAEPTAQSRRHFRVVVLMIIIPHFPSIVDIQCGEKAILL